MIRSIACTCVLSVAVYAPLFAQKAKPDFSGRWTLDLARSDVMKLGPFYKCCYPKTCTEVIDHKEPSIKITRDSVDVDIQGKEMPFKTVQDLTTDGRENITKEVNSSPSTSTSHWEGDRLVTTKIVESGAAFIWVRHLSPDGKTLTEELYVDSRKSKPNTFVFQRR